MLQNNIFSDRIKLLRKKAGLSQSQLAAIIGITKSSINKIESGVRAASIEVIYALADYFDTSIDYLIGRSDEPNPQSPWSDEKETQLHVLYAQLDDYSRGMLLERARMLLDDTGK